VSENHIQQSIEGVIKYLSEHPGECRYTDKAATAVVEEGLRCRAEQSKMGVRAQQSTAIQEQALGIDQPQSEGI